MTKPSVFVTRKIPEPGLKLLRKYCDVTMSHYDRPLTKRELLRNIKGKDALLCLLTDKIDEEIIKANTNLKIIANYAVGFDNIDLQAAKKYNIVVTNTPGVLTETVAEHAVALMMAIARRIPEADQFTKRGKYKGWGPLMFLGSDIAGKTLGILGLGRIGSAVAERASFGLGMKVLYYDVNRNPDFEKKYNAKYADVSALLKNSDFVTVHVPLIPSTKHLIGEKELRMMKKSSYLINTSRGPVIDEKALVNALKHNIIRGAALDVFEYEPKLSPGLKNLSNVILTPHIASATEETRGKMAELAANNIIAVFQGKKPPNIVEI